MNLQLTPTSWPLSIGTNFMAPWPKSNTTTDDSWWRSMDGITCMPRPVSGMPLITPQRNRMLAMSNWFSIFFMRVTPSLSSNLCCCQKAEARLIGVIRTTTCTVCSKEEVSDWDRVMAFSSMCPILGCWIQSQRGLTLVSLK